VLELAPLISAGPIIDPAFSTLDLVRTAIEWRDCKKLDMMGLLENFRCVSTTIAKCADNYTKWVDAKTRCENWDKNLLYSCRK
jgi:hypothetical protein